MYTDKKNILQLAALLKAHGVKKFVLCPGSRDIPIVQTLADIPELTCYPVTDERSAGFFALGLSQNENVPVGVCCTSGSALLNLHPAVAEAFYQQIPLVVISADRPRAWIGQMDGQTLPQPGVFRNLVRKSVDLPEIHTEEDEWYCNRLINEALLELNHHGQGPIHINVPVSQPFFQHPTAALPAVRIITRHEGDTAIQAFAEKFKRYKCRMIVAGQANPEQTLSPEAAEQLTPQFAWIAETTANLSAPAGAIHHIEQLLASLDNDTHERMRPELLVTYGGHIISGRLKKFLRRYPPVEHWHITPDGQVTDLFQSLTDVVEMNPYEFLEKVACLTEEKNSDYPRRWKSLEDMVAEPDFPFSEMGAIGQTIHRLPSPSVLHLANSSTVRYAQLFNCPPGIKILSNRGTNGIEGSLSTAVGYASASDKLNFIFIGDLSFFYDMNALWNTNYGSNIRILLLNNSGGEIFHALPGLEVRAVTTRFVIASHQTSAQAWAEDRGFRYLSAHNDEELSQAVATFTQADEQAQPILLEVFTEKEKDVELLKTYYSKQKQLTRQQTI